MPPKKNCEPLNLNSEPPSFSKAPHRSVPLKRAGTKSKRPGSPTLWSRLPGRPLKRGPAVRPKCLYLARSSPERLWRL